MTRNERVDSHQNQAQTEFFACELGHSQPRERGGSSGVDRMGFRSISDLRLQTCGQFQLHLNSERTVRSITHERQQKGHVRSRDDPDACKRCWACMAQVFYSDRRGAVGPSRGVRRPSLVFLARHPDRCGTRMARKPKPPNEVTSLEAAMTCVFQDWAPAARREVSFFVDHF